MDLGSSGAMRGGSSPPFSHDLASHVKRWHRRSGASAPHLLEGRVKRPRKSLQPFPLVIHDCWFAARSLASVRPTVRRTRGLAPGSGSLILASVFSFLSSIAPASRTFRGPNSLSLRFISSLCLVVDCQANAVVLRETVHLATRQSYLSRASDTQCCKVTDSSHNSNA